jgi:hypothetical protein
MLDSWMPLQADSLNTMDIEEFKIFCKDNRCSHRTMSKVTQIFALASKQPLDPNSGTPEILQLRADSGLVLSEFIECLVRVAKEQLPGKEGLHKKVNVFLQHVAKRVRVAARHVQPLMAEVFCRCLSLHKSLFAHVFCALDASFRDNYLYPR